ncbi:DUF6788 family protein [Alicyclobacillus sp. SO9]|uniref:DUF6788 family protein n=1 Tax=Alicyclobacillus sp. SO9 TaxID=2665646 RepID=UPI0018E8BB4B|nr:DUF6788 family protein [Alicyclobacillus sp. SO9]QQE81551.1 hypothetical protein GI364_24945 [Alicyclobacillus sp. SO9]
MAVQYEGWSIVAQYRKCGKQGCKTCSEGPGHGPYYYGTKVIDGRRRSKYFGKTLPTDDNSQDDIQDVAVLQSKIQSLEREKEQFLRQVRDLEERLSAYQNRSKVNQQHSSAIDTVVQVEMPASVHSVSHIEMNDSGELSRDQIEMIWNEESSQVEATQEVLSQAHNSYINGLFRNTQDKHTRLNQRGGNRPFVCPFRSGGRGGHRTFGNAERLVRTAVPWLIENVSKQQATKYDIASQAERKRQGYRNRYQAMPLNQLQALQDKMRRSVESGNAVGWTMSLSELEQQLKMIEKVIAEKS